MSSIDKYWSDRLIYHIGFIANVSKTNSLVEKKEFHRTFIFPSSLTEMDIKKMIFHKLDNVIEITYIEEFVEALELRTGNEPHGIAPGDYNIN